MAEASNGLEAVAKVAELQPVLVLLDHSDAQFGWNSDSCTNPYGCSQNEIFVLSQNTDPGIVEAALSDGVAGYVVKARTNSDLLLAIEAVLSGKKFVSCPTSDLNPARRGA